MSFLLVSLLTSQQTSALLLPRQFPFSLYPTLLMLTSQHQPYYRSQKRLRKADVPLLLTSQHGKVVKLDTSSIIAQCLTPMPKEKENDPGRDQSDNTPTIYLRSLGAIEGNLEEIQKWEIQNSAWVDSLDPRINRETR
jgi:hypothetical protein